MSVFERTARPHSPQSALTLEWRCSRRYELTGASARSASWARPEWLLRLADAGNGITLAIRRLGRVDSGFPDRVTSSRKRGAPGRRSACMVVRRFSRTASAGLGRDRFQCTNGAIEEISLSFQIRENFWSVQVFRALPGRRDSRFAPPKV
jgi:hypothetical protein